MKVYIIGAGPGDPELLTLKARRIIGDADVILYAGSLVNPEILRYAREGADIHNTAEMDLEEIVGVMAKAVGKGRLVARVHTGDPSIYGAIGEQMALLEEKGIEYEVVPGVSSFLAAAAALKKEYTVPEVSQTVIITRLEGRTPVPERQRLRRLAEHRASLCVFLSVHMIKEVVEELREGYGPDAPVAVVEKASWDGEKVVLGTLKDIAAKVKKANVEKTALILVGDFLRPAETRSRLYAREFSHGFRKGRPKI